MFSKPLLPVLPISGAIMVIWLFSSFSFSPGFVVGYAYDDRWKRMGTKEFFKRRLIRLHPMVVVGALLGVAAFFIQGSVQWDGTKVATLHGYAGYALYPLYDSCCAGHGSRSSWQR